MDTARFPSSGWGLGEGACLANPASCRPPGADPPCHVTCDACWEATPLWTDKHLSLTNSSTRVRFCLNVQAQKKSGPADNTLFFAA